MFINSAELMLDAKTTHHDHAIIERVIADLEDSALAQLLAACVAIAVHFTEPLAN